MCGIAGAVGYVDEAVVEAVGRISGAQAHRGPDGAGLWIGSSLPDPRGVVLAHRRLAIIDLTEGGAQPMTDPESGTTLVYNGEVYNYRDLRRVLERCGARFRTACDTEVVLSALAHWGVGAVDAMRGMFALAAWNPATRQLHLARDRLGIKPLYLTVRQTDAGCTVYFASELRALLAGGIAPRTIDPAGLSSFLWNGFVVGPNTMIRGISLLPAGTHMTITAGQRPPEPQRYWQIPKPDQRTIPDEVRQELLAAVRMRLVADVPLGIFLSGGVDSSAVAALACTAADDVRTFTIGFDDPQHDESRYARAVADALQTSHTTITLSEQDFIGQLPGALEAIDQPTFDAINTYCVSKAVRDAGITVALAGTGGDELFGGYRSFVDVPRAVAWSRRMAPLPQRLVSVAAGGIAAVRTGRTGGVGAQTRWGKLGDALNTRGDLLRVYQVAYSLFTRDFLDTLTAGVASDNGTCFGLPHARALELDRLLADSPTLHAVSMMELSCFITERLLRDTDAAGMAVSLEVRVPLLDHQVVQAVAGLDERQRFAPLGGKRLLRKLALERLDPAIFNRAKAGFVMPLDRWCRSGLRGAMDEAFHDTGLCQSVGLNSRSVLALWQAFDAGAPGVYWSRVWALYVLLWWCRRYGVSL